MTVGPTLFPHNITAPVSAQDNSEAKSNEGKHVSEADDVLNVDCTEEVDEFTNFLNEFEDELKDKPNSSGKQTQVGLIGGSFLI